MRNFTWVAGVAACFIWSSATSAQQEQPPADGQPQPEPGQPQPEPGQQQAGPAEQQPGAGQPSAQQQPGSSQPQQGYPQQQPGYGQQQPGYADPNYPGYSGYGQAYEPPPPPPPPPPKSGEMPDFSIRLDPVTLLVSGLLNPELEIELFDYMTLEVVPEFVTSSKPPLINISGLSYASGGDVLSRHSNGAGPLSGGSVGVGFWPGGKPFEGYVIRALLANWAYEYRTDDSQGRIDTVKHTNRWLSFFLGSHNRWGFFTLVSGIGLRIELNKEERCVSSVPNCDGDLLMAVDRTGAQEPINLNGPLHPVDIFWRLSLGVVF